MFEEILIEPSFEIIKVINEDLDSFQYIKNIPDNYIQFHYNIGNGGVLHYYNNYEVKILPQQSLLLFNPKQNLPVNLSLYKQSKHLILLFSLEKFHSFFLNENRINIFEQIDISRHKYYEMKVLDPTEILVVNQIFNSKTNESINKLYLKAKTLELISLYLMRENEAVCPFLEDEEVIKKIKKAKELLISGLPEPLSLYELSLQVKLSIPKLRKGFKHLYGKNISEFIHDYKLDYARDLLLSKKYNINEVSSLVGYSSPSHFIVAFKKKFGITPKQYMMHS